MPITFQGAPYPADPARLTVDNNFTTRPTSSGVGTLSANSLVTRADGDTRFWQRQFARQGAQISKTDNILTNIVSFPIEAGTYRISARVVARIEANGNTSGGAFVSKVGLYEASYVDTFARTMSRFVMASNMQDAFTKTLGYNVSSIYKKSCRSSSFFQHFQR